VNVVSAYPVSESFEGWGAKAESGVYLRFKQRLQERGVPLRFVAEGDQLPMLDQVRLGILHPAKNYRPRKHPDNNLSVVTLASFGPFNLALPGDLEKEGLLRLFRAHRPFPRVDWLMAPHHGRKSGEPALCAEGFRPRFVVFSDWRDYPRTRDQYRAIVPDAVVLSTAEEGAIEVEMNLDGQGRYRSFRNRNWKAFSMKNLPEH
jgi:beta-lactamase superfamily II metal-dependent hydrolase